jgi:hypothetical protein
MAGDDGEFSVNHMVDRIERKAQKEILHKKAVELSKLHKEYDQARLADEAAGEEETIEDVLRGIVPAAEADRIIKKHAAKLAREAAEKSDACRKAQMQLRSREENLNIQDRAPSMNRLRATNIPLSTAERMLTNTYGRSQIEPLLVEMKEFSACDGITKAVATMLITSFLYMLAEAVPMLLGQLQKYNNDEGRLEDYTQQRVSAEPLRVGTETIDGLHVQQIMRRSEAYVLQDKLWAKWANEDRYLGDYNGNLNSELSYTGFGAGPGVKSPSAVDLSRLFKRYAQIYKASPLH